MADLDFNITIKTIADTTGIKLTEQGLNAIKIAALQGNKEAIAALQNLTAAQKQASEQSLGLASAMGSTLGRVGGWSLIALLTGAIYKWQQFNEEQNKEVDRMLANQEKIRESGLALADQIDQINFRHAVEAASDFATKMDLVARRGQTLQEEFNSLFSAGKYDDAKKILGVLQQLESEFGRLGAAAEKAAEAKDKAESSFFEGALKTAAPQVQAALANEEAARNARAAGQERDADLFQKTSEQLQRGMTQPQREEFEGLKGAGDQKLHDAIVDLKQSMDKYWGP